MVVASRRPRGQPPPRYARAGRGASPGADPPMRPAWASPKSGVRPRLWLPTARVTQSQPSGRDPGAWRSVRRERPPRCERRSMTSATSVGVGPAEQVPLPLIAAEAAQLGELLRRLDALGHGLQPERAGRGRRRRGRWRRPRGSRAGRRRRTGPPSARRSGSASGSSGSSSRSRSRRWPAGSRSTSGARASSTVASASPIAVPSVISTSSPDGVEPGLRQHLSHVLHQSRVAELARREVDGHHEIEADLGVGAPYGRLPAGRLEHPPRRSAGSGPSPRRSG